MDRDELKQKLTLMMEYAEKAHTIGLDLIEPYSNSNRYCSLYDVFLIPILHNQRLKG